MGGDLREKLERSKFSSVLRDGLSARAMEDPELVYVQFAPGSCIASLLGYKQ